METIITTLKPFFEDPNKKYSIRELARKLNINHTTVRQHLNKLTEEGFLLSTKDRIYTFYELTLNKKTLNLKRYYNLEKIRKSNLIEFIERHYDMPTIVLFGGFANATDDSNSDIDICLTSNINKKFNTERFEKDLNRKISIHKYTKESWQKAKKTNPNLINSICNGIVLSGQLEVL